MGDRVAAWFASAASANFTSRSGLLPLDARCSTSGKGTQQHEQQESKFCASADQWLNLLLSTTQHLPHAAVTAHAAVNAIEGSYIIHALAAMPQIVCHAPCKPTHDLL
jgi:hypothetical protein